MPPHRQSHLARSQRMTIVLGIMVAVATIIVHVVRANWARINLLPKNVNGFTSFG